MNTKVKSIIGILAVVVAILVFFWIANLLGTGEKAQSEKPLVICNPPGALPERQKCNWTAHIHFNIKAFKGSEELPIGFEQGDLQGMHTHAESQKVHWHGLIQVDPRTKEVADWSALEVRKLPGDLNISQPGTPKFIVNGKEVGPSAVWKDGDVIEIKYE